MASTYYKNVMLVGATGNLGKYILESLLADSSFFVTVLTRINSSATFPSNVNLIKTDYSDTKALVKALSDQDVVISAVGGEGLAVNFDLTLVQAALNAGVKWFIPSEFGIDTSHSTIANNPVLASKRAVAYFLKENQARIAHTFIITGIFLDWGFENGFLGFDITNRIATLYDEGKHLVSGTTLPHIGQAVVAVLHHPQATQNNRIYIADTTFTQQEALFLFEKYTKSKWTTKQVTTESLLKQGAKSFAKGDTMTAIISYLLSAIYSGQGASNFENKTNNEALNLKTKSLRRIAKKAVLKKNCAN
ncbi:unnamed protein product [Rotaria sp. Silwood2]|nr:unnamed protein product [Rotaria sp. Silwood2]